MKEIIITNKNVHNKFKLNGYHLKAADLSRVAYSYIKEGDGFEKQIGEFLLDWLDEKPYVKMTTSGTTSAPKEIKLAKKAMIASAIATGDFFGLKPGDKALHCLSANFIAGKMMIVRSLILGLDLDFVTPSSTPLERNTTVYDFVAMVPMQVENSISGLKNVKKLIVGGASMNTELKQKIAQLKTEVYETYGMTETITHIAAKKVSEEAFTILPNISISKDDRNCLVISAPKLIDDPIITNDLVEFINDKQFLLLGRVDNVVNSGGVKLIPEQIEAKLSGKIKERFFVIGLPDETLGEKLVLVIEGNSKEIDSAIFENLDKFQKPKEIVFVSKFKETDSGKVKRKETILG